MITKTYVVKMAAEGDAIQHRDFVSAEIEKITFVRPVNVLCIDRDVPDSRFMREDLYSQEELDKAYARGLRQGKKEGWSLARTLVLTPEDGGIGHAEITAAFGEAASGYMIMRDLGVFGAEQMYKEWRTAPLEVGDIVILKDANPVRGVVTSVEKDSEFCYGILFEDGMHGSFCLDDLEKTGEHVDLTDIFKKLKGEE